MANVIFLWLFSLLAPVHHTSVPAPADRGGTSQGNGGGGPGGHSGTPD